MARGFTRNHPGTSALAAISGTALHGVPATGNRIALFNMAVSVLLRG